jgi:hypothetical protein
MTVIKPFDILKHTASSFLSSLKIPMVQPFLLERVEEAFDHGIIPTIALPAHRTSHSIQLK